MKNIVIGYPANLIFKSSISKCSKFYYKTLLYKKNKKAYNSFVKYLIKEDKKTENKDKRNITRKKIIN